MDMLGSSSEEIAVEDLQPTIRAAAQQALHDWGRPMDDLDDLVQEATLWYMTKPSARAWVAKAETETGRRRVFYRTRKVVLPDGEVVWQRQGSMSQILSGNQADGNIFSGEEIYSSDAVKDWLRGESTNKYVGRLIQKGLSKLEDRNRDHREAVRMRYEEGIIPTRGSAGEAQLKRAVKSLTSHVNALAIEAKETNKNTLPSRGSGPRRGVGGYSDPTADLALGLIKKGDVPQEIEGGGVTTYRKEFEQADNIFATRYDQPSPPWVGVDLFEGELNDRTDLYRAQVFPELYPNEKPMLIENWPADDREAYCGGVDTPGYRRLTVVR